MARRSEPASSVPFAPGCRRFETATRFYETMWAVDLWSTPVLSTSWGSKTTNLGQTRVVATGEEQCREMLKKIVRRRELSGYLEIKSSRI